MDLDIQQFQILTPQFYWQPCFSCKCQTVGICYGKSPKNEVKYIYNAWGCEWFNLVKGLDIDCT